MQPIVDFSRDPRSQWPAQCVPPVPSCLRPPIGTRATVAPPPEPAPPIRPASNSREQGWASRRALGGGGVQSRSRPSSRVGSEQAAPGGKPTPTPEAPLPFLPLSPRGPWCEAGSRRPGRTALSLKGTNQKTPCLLIKRPAVLIAPPRGSSASLQSPRNSSLCGPKQPRPVLANGATATSKPLQPLGCTPQPRSPNEQALPPHLEPAWPQGLRHNSVPGRVGPAEYPSPDMQRQRKTKRKTKEQLAILKSFFLQCQWARREDYYKLEQITGLPRPEIIQWFGDTRYALKHGQLKWFRDNAVPGAPSFQDSAIPTPPPSTRSLNEWAETPPLPTPPPPPDIRPLERYWAAHQQLRERDIPQLSQASRLSTQQVLDWFDSRLPEPAEVVVCLDEEEEEEEEELPEDEDEEEEEEEEDDDDDDDVIIQD
ncbi:homeobox and leucine zipper protein Homez isoform X2 [Equus asinus]|uniref:homeobox and leucine zipper protein Homez isoform X2 n=1 Tax=Equus asinus TaxID=9793 RepID=UPI0038F6A524